MADDESENYYTPEERTEILGFKPQSEININHLLPYADELDAESAKFFEEIKSNFGKAVLFREMKPGCGVWSARLMKYIRLYGLKFSKEDHITLIKLVYDLMLIPDLEPNKVHKFATLYVMLTKKRYLVSPKELTLPWRPLFDLIKKVTANNRVNIGMFQFLTNKTKKDNSAETNIKNMIRQFISGTGLEETMKLLGPSNELDIDTPMSLESTLLTVVKYSKQYFEPNTTKELIDLCCPQIVPWVHDQLSFNRFLMFLPLTLPPSEAYRGHELWFNKLMELWNTCGNSHCGVTDIMLIFSSLAKHNPGTVDWTPYVPEMFTRFMHSMYLPVSYKDMQYSRHQSLDIKHISSWIVWTISPNGVVLKHLKNFITGTLSYLHSANTGRWSFKLRDFLRKLTKQFLMRVRRERENQFKKTWENQSPESFKLRDEDITEFVEILLEPILLAINSRAEVTTVVHDLAVLRPAIVIPPILEKLRTSLESLTEPHRLTAALQAVAGVARPMVTGASAGYPEGPTHVVSLLIASLPGLDANDMKKTLSTLQFILLFSWMIPYIDCSSASDYYDDLTEHELLTCESTAQFEDFVLLFFERIFIIIESTTQEHVRLETNNSDSIRSKLETVIEAALYSASTAVLRQCSPKIFTEALNKFKRFALNTNFETTVAGHTVGLLLKMFAQIDPESTLNAFIPQLCEEVTELLAPDEALVDENPPPELLYRLLLLSFIVECNGSVVIQYLPKLLPIIDRGLQQQAKAAARHTCNILFHLMITLSTVELNEYRSSVNDYGKAPQEWLPIREWGKDCHPRVLKLNWFVPGPKEVESVQMLMDRYLKPEMHKWELWLKDELQITPENRMISLMIILSCLGCAPLMPQPDDESLVFVDTLNPGTSFRLVNSIKGQVTLDGGNVRVALVKFVRKLQTKFLEQHADDIKCLEMLPQLWERTSGIRSSRMGSSLEVRMRTYSALDRALDCRGGPVNFGRIRTLLAEATRFQDESRIELRSEAGLTKHGLIILKSLFELGINTYTSVRITAQLRLFGMLSHYPYSYKALIPLIEDVIVKGGEGEEWHDRHKGSLHILIGQKCGPLVGKHDWEAVRKLWPLILKAPLSEKPSIVRLEQMFSDTVHRTFPSVNTTLTMSPESMESAKALLSKEELEDPKFKELVAGAEAREIKTSEVNVRFYEELLSDLVSIAESPNVVWRRLELVMLMFTHCPNLQTSYIPSVVRLVLNCLIHDNIAVRRISIKLMLFILKQRKVPVKKIFVNPYDIAGVPKPENVVPGYRPDNKWVMWSEDAFPKTDEDWEKPFLRDVEFGFYDWPDELEVAAPSYEQEFVNRKPEDMEEGEKYIYEKFTDDEYINKLVGFLTVEEKKGKDKFNGHRFALFRCLFRCFGYPVASKLLKHAQRHAADSHEAPQRFAAEVAAAAVKAPRFWDRNTAYNMYNDVIRIYQTGLDNVTAETLEDWGTSVASAMEGADTSRAALVLQALLEMASPQTSSHDVDKDSSFKICARLYILQGAFNSLSWRATSLGAELLHRLEATSYIQHPYQNVRETVGSVLMTIFDTEVVFPNGSLGPLPSFAQFVDNIKQKLAILYDEHGEIVIKSSPSVAPLSGGTGQISQSPEPDIASEEVLVAVANMAGLEAEPMPVDDEPPHQGEGNSEKPGPSRLLLARGDKTRGCETRELSVGMRVGGDTADSQKDREHARTINLLTTVLRGGMGLVVRGVGGTQGAGAAGYALLRAACGLGARGPPSPHDEVARAADGFLAALAYAPHAPRVFDLALAAVEDVASSRSWWARLSCVQFAQPLLFYGLPLLCDKPERAVRAEQFALKLMRDPRLEVRRAAAKLLTGLMHCNALPNEERTIKQLMKNCRSKDIVERHCGVLGLCGYLNSRPYSLGPRIGVVLTELSRHTNAPDPVPSAIQTALAEFKRTHQDDWPKHREQLTEEELDLLADLTSPPSYCA